MRVYLSGPISLGGRLSEEEMRSFVDAFSFEASRLRDQGYEVENPCELDPEDSWGAYMRHGMRAVANADIVATMPRWTESRGATLEVFIATQLGIPIIPVSDLGAS